MLMRFASVILITSLLSACSLFNFKPEVVDSQKGAAPLTDEMLETFAQALELISDEKYIEAETVLQELAVKNPDLPGVWVNLAISLQNQKKYTEAVESSDKAIAINPQYCLAYKVKGINQREIGKFPEAKLSYVAALKCNEKDIDSLFNLGVLFDLYLHQKDQALYCYNEYQKFYVAEKQEEDKTVAIWIKTIGRKFKVTKPLELIELDAQRLALKQQKALAQKSQLDAKGAAEVVDGKDNDNNKEASQASPANGAEGQDKINNEKAAPQVEADKAAAKKAAVENEAEQGKQVELPASEETNKESSNEKGAAKK